MDSFAALIDAPSARGAFLLRIILDPPWSVRVQDEAPLSLVAMVEGGGWIVPDGGEAVPLRPGDVAVLRGPDPYSLCDDVSTAVQVIVHPGQRCATVDGVDLAQAMELGVRTWGGSPDGSMVMLVGTYERCPETSRGLLAVLPPVMVLPGGELEGPLVALLAEEIARDEPGQEVVLDRLLDLLLIAVLRAWFARPEAETPAWYRAYGDPVVGGAMRRLQNNPAHPWTVAMLAAEVGVSRAALARRFTDLVGDPPMTFVTTWRLDLAAELLRAPGATVGAVAHEVGYGSPFALSTAFKRERGLSPRQHQAVSDRVAGQGASWVTLPR